MARPANMTQNVLSGALPGGEVWQTSYWQEGYTAAEATDANCATVLANPTFQALRDAFLNLMNAGSTFTDFDRYFYAGSGGATAHGHASANSAGVGSVAHPNQVACVLTLRTGSPGRSKRGRMYFPATGAPFSGTTGMLSSTQVNTLVDTAAAWFAELETDAPVVVVSVATSSAAPVSSVDADLIADTQRRRTNKMVSTRHSATV